MAISVDLGGTLESYISELVRAKRCQSHLLTAPRSTLEPLDSINDSDTFSPHLFAALDAPRRSTPYAPSNDASRSA
jgi:hypothetical protein